MSNLIELAGMPVVVQEGIPDNCFYLKNSNGDVVLVCDGEILDVTLPKTNQGTKPMTPASKRALNRLINATLAYAFRGAAHPDVYDSIVLEYKQALKLLENRITKLETKEPNR